MSDFEGQKKRRRKKKKKKKKKKRIKKKKGFWRKSFWGKTRKSLENSRKSTNHPKPNMQQNTKTERHPLKICTFKRNPLFLSNFLFFGTCTLFSEGVLCWNTKSSVFSRAQFLWITDSNQPSRDPSRPKNTFLVQKLEFSVFPCACWSPSFVGFFFGFTKPGKGKFPKQIVLTKMPFSPFQTQVVYCNFSKKHFW